MKKTTLMMAALVALGTTAGSHADFMTDFMVGDSVELTFDQVNPSQTVDVYLGGSSMSVKGGIYRWSDDVSTFCCQLTEYISGGQTVQFDVEAAADAPLNVSGGATIGTSRATLLGDLYHRYFDMYEKQGWNGEKAAAFQVAIWEITHETSDGRTAGEILDDLNTSSGFASFNSTSEVNDLASGMIAELGGGSNDFMSDYTLVSLVNDGAQDHLAIGASNPQTVPGALGLASMVGILGAGRRRRRRS